MRVEVGTELPELVKEPTTQTLAQYAGASGDFYQIHYDREFAQGVGLPGVILHGLLKTAYLGQLVTDWLGDEGTLEVLDVSYRGMDFPGHPYRCRGVVNSMEGQRADLDVWGEDPEGRRTTVGTARVHFKGKG
ncbi:MAG: dehydratase [Candidatus Dormibacteraeota bacterium]|nr:dehydratase [Candidatus Dormibacteraeota bacterium]